MCRIIAAHFIWGQCIILNDHILTAKAIQSEWIVSLEMSSKKITLAIEGAGLVGSLFSIYLAKRGYKISVFERIKMLFI